MRKGENFIQEERRHYQRYRSMKSEKEALERIFAKGEEGWLSKNIGIVERMNSGYRSLAEKGSTCSKYSLSTTSMLP